MRLELDEDSVKVVLSKRNLLALLAKVDDPDSAKTIFMESAADGKTLWVRVEPDIVHYEDRPYGPGRMHHKAEKFIEEVTGIKHRG